jgi:hypothetical protein
VSAPLPAERRRRALSEKERETFLEALSAGWSTRHAAGLAGRSHQRFYDLRERDEAFASAWDESVELGTKRLEDEAIRRAAEGWEEPVYQKGELVGHVRRYSDQLLMFLLRGRRPGVYRDNVGGRLEVTGADGGPIEIERRNVVGISDVVRLARELGVRLPGEVDRGDPLAELPPALHEGEP